MGPLAAAVSGITFPKQFRAKHRYARLTARKARLISGLICGRSANEALEILEFAPQRAASFYLKVLKSAMANASEREANVNRLFVQLVRVDQGPTIKRFRPKDRGRAHPILKRTCHITITVEEE